MAIASRPATGARTTLSPRLGRRATGLRRGARASAPNDDCTARRGALTSPLCLLSVPFTDANSGKEWGMADSERRGVALVIGAGDATGSAIAARFAREGYTACLTRRSADRLEPA